MAREREDAKHGPYKLNPVLMTQVLERLELRWSPEQISNRLRVEGQQTVSAETIYKLVDEDRDSGGELWKFLRRSSRQRRRRFPSEDRRGQIQNATPISKRSRKANKYVSLMADIDGARILDVVPDRTLEAADTLWQKLPEEVRGGINAVAMDMWDAFITSTRKHAPQADIVHDKFHIAKYLGEAVDKVRRAEHKAFMKDGGETLKGALFPKSPENMSDLEKDRFKSLRMDKLKAGRAWSIKETFSEFWTYSYQASAEKFFSPWYWWATHSRLKPMIDATTKDSCCGSRCS